MLAPVAIVAPAPSSQALDEAARALAAGRSQQARTMIAEAVRNGAVGTQVDRLLADLAFAQGEWAGALARYKALLAAGPADPLMQVQAGIAALHAGAVTVAVGLLDQATAQPTAGWRAWNARAVAADRQADWLIADRAYAQAAKLAPDNAHVLNNCGWSRLLRGDWKNAAELLSRAAAMAPANPRIAANLDLARSAASATFPTRLPGESGQSFAARLNDAGVVAWRGGDRQKAVAAFAQALEASDQWFARAANNLAQVEQSQ